MSSIDIINFLSDPFVISYQILLLMVLPALIAMFIGKAVDGNQNKVWANRGTGLELFFVLLPFFVHIIISVFHGSINKVLISPELPMASLIICGMIIFGTTKIANATKGRIRNEIFTTIQLLSFLFFITNTIAIYYLTTADNISNWFSVFNSALIFLSLFLGYGLMAAMTYIERHTEEFLNNVGQDQK
ncbi:hypothetical protein LZ640_20040 [Aeromonas media]|uniref:hypothetical protein n=1 Tax=Aeromonas TaxID=642 RepID=UPI001F487265|nr:MULTISPECIES: hypothetical protein [Aeromonas]MCE9926702.1 hypothetical protein [Aeromonas media]MDM5124630.1 hypothetical protein [Aeromonas rivipollensis]